MSLRQVKHPQPRAASEWLQPARQASTLRTAPVQLRAAPERLENALQTVAGQFSSRSAVQPRSGSRSPVSSLENRKSLCSAVQPPSGSNPSVHFGCRAFAAPAASARATGPTGLCDILIVADRLPRKDANGITQPRKVLYIFLNAKPRLPPNDRCHAHSRPCLYMTRYVWSISSELNSPCRLGGGALLSRLSRPTTIGI